MAMEEWLGCDGKSAATAELANVWHSRVQPFWGLFPGIYEKLAAVLLRRGESFLAAEVAGEATQRFPENALLWYQQALALARIGGRDRAMEIVTSQWDCLATLSDARPLIGRLYKDAWKASGNAADLEKARDEYAAAAVEPRDDVYYPAVNAVTLSALLGDQSATRRFAQMVETDLADRGGASNYWERASLAEARLATGDLTRARAMYAEAVSDDVARDQVLTTREQAVLLLDHLGLDRGSLDGVLGRPVVLAVTGHRIDAPDRAQARFPSERIDSVRSRIQEAINHIAPWMGLAGGADGTDLMALELMREAGIDTAVVLPLARDRFAAESVAREWRESYDVALAAAVTVWESPQRKPGTSGDLWEFGNGIILGSVMRRAFAWRCESVLLAVWDGQRGDGGGGTADMVDRAANAGMDVWVINPLNDEPAWRWPDTEPRSGGNIPAWFCVHVAGTMGNGAELAEMSAGALEIVDLEPAYRAVFAMPAEALHFALNCRLRLPDAGIGLSAGPQSQSASSYFRSQAAKLAQLAREFSGMLAGWEFVALTPNLDKFSFESAGRRELGEGVLSEVFAVAISDCK